ncbi:MAG TPA: glycosyltransferase family 2 protein, partial [Gaiellaceae bacterium]|nr:glycosyltransferase family 2 protein [Gaiellaceae bacterium]
DVDVVVVDNESTDGTAELVESEFPEARVVTSRNHGFSHANNRALMTVDARYVLFLNPDTEILSGSLEDLVRRLDAAPEVGLAGVVQTLADGRVWPSMRRFPNAWLTLMETLGSERVPFRAGWLTTRELDLRRYEEEFDLDWTSGSFMLVRREALESAGWLDERFFLYSDETDLALRIKKAGWVVRHYPHMRIVHHYGKQGFSRRGYAQAALSHRIYAQKHFSPPHRLAFAAALAAYYATRIAAYGVVHRSDTEARTAMKQALGTLLGRSAPPYQPVPPAAVRPREPENLRQPA